MSHIIAKIVTRWFRCVSRRAMKMQADAAAAGAHIGGGGGGSSGSYEEKRLVPAPHIGGGGGGGGSSGVNRYEEKRLVPANGNAHLRRSAMSQPISLHQPRRRPQQCNHVSILATPKDVVTISPPRRIVDASPQKPNQQLPPNPNQPARRLL